MNPISHEADKKRAYYLANRERILANIRARQNSMTEEQKAHRRQRVNAWSKTISPEKKELVRFYNSEWSRSLPEEKKAKRRENNRRWYAARTEAQLARHNEREIARLAARDEVRKLRDLELRRVWKKANPESKKASDHKRKALKRKCGGSFTSQEWHELLIRSEHKCLKCGRSTPEIVLTVDHVIPISKGGRNVISNIQPLCVSCNSSKSAKHIDYRVGR